MTKYTIAEICNAMQLCEADAADICDDIKNKDDEISRAVYHHLIQDVGADHHPQAFRCPRKRDINGCFQYCQECDRKEVEAFSKKA